MFSCSQLRGSSYKGKLCDWYAVPPSVIVSTKTTPPASQHDHEESPSLPVAISSAPTHTENPLPAPTELAIIPLADRIPQPFNSEAPTPQVSHCPSSPLVPPDPDFSVADINAATSSPESGSVLPEPRPHRKRRPPSYLSN